MTSKNTLLKTLPLMAVLFAALSACGGGDIVDPGVQTAQADFNASTAPQTAGQPGTVAPVPELQADAADLAAAAAAAATAAVPATPAAPVEPIAGVVDATANAAANAVTLAPDCAAQGCSGLRVIDGNAEAYRADAQVRENREQAPAN